MSPIIPGSRSPNAAATTRAPITPIGLSTRSRHRIQSRRDGRPVTALGLRTGLGASSRSSPDHGTGILPACNSRRNYAGSIRHSHRYIRPILSSRTPFTSRNAIAARLSSLRNCSAPFIPGNRHTGLFESLVITTTAPIPNMRCHQG